jgi:ankyrin repeat protein
MNTEEDPPVLKVARETINKGDLAAFRVYLDAKPERLYTETPFGTWLHLAIMRGQPEIAKYLIARGLDVNANSGISESNAADFAASEGDLEMLQYVHEQGAIFDTTEPTKNPLFSAIVGGHVDVVRYLLEHGIDYSVRYNSETMTEMDALQFAEERGETECATIIRKHSEAQKGG